MFEQPPPATPGKASPRSQRTRAGFEDHAGTKMNLAGWKTVCSPGGDGDEEHCSVMSTTQNHWDFRCFRCFFVLEWFMPLCHKHGGQIQFREIAGFKREICIRPFFLGSLSIMIEMNSFGSLSHVQISSKFCVWCASVWTILDTWKCIVLAKFSAAKVS